MASIFDTLLAPFNTSSQDAAAQAQQNALMQGWQQYANYGQQAQNQLQNAFNQYQGYINQYFPQAQQALQANYGAGLAPVSQNIQNAQAGTNQLMNLLGIGQGGGAGAQQTLQNLPGYQFAVQQATDAVNRNQAAQGALNSGGTNVDLANYIQGLASQNYNNYVNQLQPFLGAANTAAGQGLQGYGQLGSGLAGLLSGQGAALGGAAQNLGSGLANISTGLGSTAYGTEAGIGQAQANAALAPLQAGQNLWGLIGNIAKLGTSGSGGGGGGTGGGTIGGNFLNWAGPQVGNAASNLFSGWGGAALAGA